MLDSNKSTNFNKKSHFKAFVYVSYDMYDFTIRYNSYNTHTVSYDSWALTIRRYHTKLFTHETIRIAYCTILTTTDKVLNGWTASTPMRMIWSLCQRCTLSSIPLAPSHQLHCIMIKQLGAAKIPSSSSLSLVKIYL